MAATSMGKRVRPPDLSEQRDLASSQTEEDLKSVTTLQIYQFKDSMDLLATYLKNKIESNTAQEIPESIRRNQSSFDNFRSWLYKTWRNSIYETSQATASHEEAFRLLMKIFARTHDCPDENVDFYLNPPEIFFTFIHLSELYSKMKLMQRIGPVLNNPEITGEDLVTRILNGQGPQTIIPHTSAK